MQLSNHVKIIDLAAAQTAATSDYSSASVVDTKGFKGVRFIVKFGTSAVDNGIKAVQQDTASGFGTAADIAGSKVLLDGTSKIAICDIYRPLERYLKPIIVRATSSTIDSIVAELYEPLAMPITSDASVTSEKHVSPAEGTA